MSKKRVLASAMWIYSCWMLGGLVELLVGAPAFLGLVLGVVPAVFFGLDPLGVVWTKTEKKAPRPSLATPIGSASAMGSVAAE